LETTHPIDATTSTLRRTVLALAWPVIAENLLETLLGIVDTAFVGALGASAIAGVGSAQQAQYLLISVLSAVSIGSAVLVAQAFGAQDRQRAGQLARQSLIWSAIVSIPLAIGGLLLSRPFMRTFGMDAEATEIGAQYLDVTMGTVIVLVGLFIGSGVLRGIGDSRTPMLVTLLANAINIPLTYALIHGSLGLPEMGAVGSAVATFIARLVALIVLLYVLWRGRDGVGIRGSGWRPDLSVLRSVLSIGVPAAVEQVLTTLAFVGLTIVVGNLLGTVTLAAHRVTIAISSFSFLPGFGFAIAATTLAGQAIGARRPDDVPQIARIAATWAAIWMGIVGVLITVFAEQLLRAFTTDQAVIDAGLNGLRVLGISCCLALPFMFVYGGALRGTGDTRGPLIVQSIGWWLAVGLVWLALTLIPNSGLGTVWIAYIFVTPWMALITFGMLKRRIARMSGK
jgi:multidrug resistance protein, MATE family